LKFDTIIPSYRGQVKDSMEQAAMSVVAIFDRENHSIKMLSIHMNE